MTLTKDKAVQIFANLIKDPYFQKTRNKSREEVVWEEAKQRARQAINNDIALSMAASDDEFGAVKSFLAFMQKAKTEYEDVPSFTEEAQAKIKELDLPEHVQAWYDELVEFPERGEKEGKLRRLTAWMEDNPDIIPTERVARKAPEVTAAQKKEKKRQEEIRSDLVVIEERERIRREEDPDAPVDKTDEEAQEEIQSIKEEMVRQQGGKIEQFNSKGQPTGAISVPATVTESGRRVSEFARPGSRSIWGR